MIPLLHFAVSALLVSGAAALSVRVMTNAPPRLKFWLAMLGLGAWLFPWPLTTLPPLFAAAPPIAGWIGESVRIVSTGAEQAAPLAAAEVGSFVPPAVWLLLLAPGLVWFALDCSAQRRTLAVWRRNGRDGSALLRLVPQAAGGRRPRVRVVAESATAAASGVFRPTLWIGARLGGDVRRTALIHEYCHVQSHDPLWLLLIHLIRRAFCWNPVVAVLARDAELWLEAACDRRCARVLGRQTYGVTLARLILSREQEAQGVAASIGGRNRNVRRLALLQSATRIGWREWACLMLCASTALGGIGLAAAPHDPRIGRWAEVGESAPAAEPILRTFEDLGAGLTRLKDDVLHDGTATLWADYRCDGRAYTVHARPADRRTESTLSCRILDLRTVEVTLASEPGGRPVRRAIDRVSADGETYTSTIVERTPDGGDGESVTRVFWRLH